MKRRLRYKGIEVGAFGTPILFEKRPDLKKNPELRTRTLYSISFASVFNDKSPKNLIVIYDIPEEKKKERDWFRRQLKNFNFVMIQRSVWVGPAPLPQDFLEYVKSIGLKNKFKTFKLAASYLEKNNHFS